MHRANGTTRHQILTAIKLCGSMTADLLGREMGISAVAVRQHLSALEAEGLVRTSIERRGLGRPVHRYSITEAGDEVFPRRYAQFAIAVLDEVRQEEGDREVDHLIHAVCRSQAAAVQPRMAGKPLAARVAELARIRTEAGYMAESEGTDEGYRLVQHNCAICQVARAHPSVCEHETAMLGELLGPEVRVVRESHILAGDHTCSYRITAS